MKKAIFAALMLCSTVLLASTTTRFLALMVWAVNLNTQTAEWNQHCADKDHREPNCDMVRAIIGDQLNTYITVAGTFKSEETGCLGDLQNRVVKHQIRLFLYNLDCGGQDLPDGEAGAKKLIQCHAENTAINDESAKLKQEIAECQGSKKL